MQTKIKGKGLPKEELSPYTIGLARLHDMCISRDNFTVDEIMAIGFNSLCKRRIELGKVRNVWVVYNPNRTKPEGFRSYYAIIGRKVYRTAGQGRVNRSRGIDQMKPGSIFKAFQERKPSRKGRGPHTRINEKIQIDKQFYGI